MSHYLTSEEQVAKSREVTLAQRDPDYMLTLTFRRDARGWAAEVPSHTRSENAMVAGADVVIERMSQGDDTVEVKFRTVESETLGKPLVTMTRLLHRNGYGAEYLVRGVTAIPFPAYLCDVTHDITGEHPERLLVYAISHYNT